MPPVELYVPAPSVNHLQAWIHPGRVLPRLLGRLDPRPTRRRPGRLGVLQQRRPRLRAGQLPHAPRHAGRLIPSPRAVSNSDPPESRSSGNTLFQNALHTYPLVAICSGPATAGRNWQPLAMAGRSRQESARAGKNGTVPCSFVQNTLNPFDVRGKRVPDDTLPPTQSVGFPSLPVRGLACEFPWNWIPTYPGTCFVRLHLRRLVASLREPGLPRRSADHEDRPAACLHSRHLGYSQPSVCRGA